MKARYNWNGGYRFITSWKIYEVENEEDENIYINDDEWDLNFYPKKYFEIIEEKFKLFKTYQFSDDEQSRSYWILVFIKDNIYWHVDINDMHRLWDYNYIISTCQAKYIREIDTLTELKWDPEMEKNIKLAKNMIKLWNDILERYK